jgi:predicted anti-sigma-YlaC factor YlaD
MKTNCLNERDLLLCHYGEAPDEMTTAAATAHLAGCPDCQARRERLATDLSRLPAAADPDPVAATRVTARVSERLQQKRRWLPMAGAVSAAALVLALVVWMPPFDQPRSPVSQQPVASTQSPTLGPPPMVLDLDLLDQLDLLEDLETLQALEGV